MSVTFKLTRAGPIPVFAVVSCRDDACDIDYPDWIISFARLLLAICGPSS